MGRVLINLVNKVKKMKQIQFGKEENIVYDKVVNKVRAVILNKEGKALLVKYAGLYMLPGGRVDSGEQPLEALKREILEESGIEIDSSDAQEFLQIDSYRKKYYSREHNELINRITHTKIYFVETNQDINEQKKKLTQSEIEENHKISFENLSVIPYLVQTNQNDNSKKTEFDREILTAFKEFTIYREQISK